MTPTVLMAHPSSSLYGADRMMLESVTAMVEGGWRAVVTVPEFGPLIELLHDRGADVRVIDAPVLRRATATPLGAARFSASSAMAAARVRAALKEVDPDVVYVNTLTFPIWLACARALRIATVCHVHEAEAEVPRMVRSGLNSPLWLADRVITNSHAARSVVVDAHPGLARRTIVLHNGVAAPAHVTSPRAMLTGRTHLVVVGRLSARKGTDVAIRSVRELVDRGHDVDLTLVGSVFRGNEAFEAELHNDVQRLGLQDRVQFAGLVPDVWPLYAAADIAVVPSLAEPFGNTAVEAMMAGRPLVGSWVQGLREIITPGKTGLVATPGDAAALADAIEATIVDWPASLRRSEAARGEALARFSPARYASDLFKLCTAVTPRVSTASRIVEFSSPATISGNRPKDAAGTPATQSQVRSSRTRWANSEQKTILIAQPSASLYGADRMLAESVTALVSDGWRVAVAIAEDGPLVELLESRGARVEVVSAPVLRRAAASPKGAVEFLRENVQANPGVRSFIRRAKPDVVYVNTLTYPLWLAAARSMGIPAVCHVREAEDAVSPVVRSALTSPLLLADVVIANSALTQSVLVAAQPRLASKSVVVHNGFAGPSDPTAPRATLTSPVKVVVVGRLSARKGSDVAIEAQRILADRGYDVDLALVGSVFRGNEPFEASLHALAQSYGLEDRVDFRGMVSNVWPEYERADIVMLPTLAESFGNTAVEAMLARRPIVSSWLQGLREIVSPGTTGLVAVPGDAKSFADGVAATIEDWPSALLRTETALADARNRFTSARYAEALSEVLNAAMRRESVVERSSLSRPPAATMTPPTIAR